MNIPRPCWYHINLPTHVDSMTSGKMPKYPVTCLLNPTKLSQTPDHQIMSGSSHQNGCKEHIHVMHYHPMFSLTKVISLEYLASSSWPFYFTSLHRLCALKHSCYITQYFNKHHVNSISTQRIEVERST